MDSAVGLVLTCLHDTDHLSGPPADLNGTAPELPVAVPSGPFRHTGLSKAARTHRLRKLRSPAKCRECNSYVYFQGAECEEVSGPRDAGPRSWAPPAELGRGLGSHSPVASSGAAAGRVLRASEIGGAARAACSLHPSPTPQCCLACHKKCLETLAIQCGHKKLQGRLQLFGQDFSQAARGTPDGVPFILKKCVCEIERRALRTKVTSGRRLGPSWGLRGETRPGGRAEGRGGGAGRRAWQRLTAGAPARTPQGIYRVNGVKTRVEKLCQAFENGKELVELSQASPHDISNVLKLYLRQVSLRGRG